MINLYEDLNKKTQQLENQISTLSSQTDNLKKNSIFTNKKNFVNCSVVGSRKIYLTEFTFETNNDLCFQLNVLIKISAKQKISFSIIANDEIICKHSEEYSVGMHQINLSKDYIPLENKSVKLFLEITSIDDKFISLVSSNLHISGLNQEKPLYKYQSLSQDENYLVSYCYNGELFYTFTIKDTCNLSSEDFINFSSAKSYAFAVLNSKIYLFRVDLDNNLFYSQFPNKNETFILSDVNSVSTVALSSKIIISIVKEKKCYVCELDNENFSELKEITCTDKQIVNSYLYLNNFSNKIYLILTDSEKMNYILESINETTSTNELLNISYNINIQTYGESDEISTAQ